MTDWRGRADSMAKALDAAPSCQHSGDSLIVVCEECLVSDAASLAAEAEAKGIDRAATVVEETWINGGAIETVCDLSHVVEAIRALKAKTGAGKCPTCRHVHYERRCGVLIGVDNPFDNYECECKAKTRAGECGKCGGSGWIGSVQDEPPPEPCPFCEDAKTGEAIYRLTRLAEFTEREFGHSPYSGYGFEKTLYEGVRKLKAKAGAR